MTRTPTPKQAVLAVLIATSLMLAACSKGDQQPAAPPPQEVVVVTLKPQTVVSVSYTHLDVYKRQENLRATTDLAAALKDAAWVLVAVPSHAFAETLQALAPLRPADAGVAWATKGLSLIHI